MYALLGLVTDGDDGVWQRLVSYAPEFTKHDVYTGFASAMVQRGEGFNVLLQAGVTGEGSEKVLPSWVLVCTDSVSLQCAAQAA